VTASDPPDPVDAQILRAEEAYAAGDIAAAAAGLRRCVAEPAATPAQRAEAASDLAVIRAGQGADEEATALLLHALSDCEAHLPSLQNLAAICTQRGDLVQATHWLRRATESAPHSAEVWRALAAALLERRRHTEARDALSRAQALGADVTSELASVDVFISRANLRPDPSDPVTVERVLIVTDWFHPTVGGTERLAEATGLALQAQGFSVGFASRALAERTEYERFGMPIHEVAGDVVASVQAIATAGEYDAILTFAHPMCWPLAATLRLPPPRPRLMVVPCVNAENFSDLHAHPQLMREHAALMGEGDVVCHSSHAGYDARLADELMLPSIYLPNAVDHAAVATAASPLAEFGGTGPRLLAIGNLWPQKNHAGLLRTLAGHDGDWRLAIVGHESPEAPETSAEIRELAAADTRVRLLGPLPPSEVAAAIADADLLLLPSLAEATPLVLLEAMRGGLPWIATPTSGSAHDHSGGLILPLELFGRGIDFLSTHPDLTARLGAAGHDHWEACYTWEVLGPRYAALLRGHRVADLTAPDRALRDTEEVRRAFYDSLIRRSETLPDVGGPPAALQRTSGR
jgi:glycosyltransferase involved in cell wall biosynthesis